MRGEPRRCRRLGVSDPSRLASGRQVKRMMSAGRAAPFPERTKLSAPGETPIERISFSMSADFARLGVPTSLVSVLATREITSLDLSSGRLGSL